MTWATNNKATGITKRIYHDQHTLIILVLDLYLKKKKKKRSVGVVGAGKRVADRPRSHNTLGSQLIPSLLSSRCVDKGRKAGGYSPAAQEDVKCPLNINTSFVHPAQKQGSRDVHSLSHPTPHYPESPWSLD